MNYGMYIMEHQNNMRTTSGTTSGTACINDTLHKYFSLIQIILEAYIGIGNSMFEPLFFWFGKRS